MHLNASEGLFVGCFKSNEVHMSQYIDEKEAALWPRLYERLDSLDDESLKPPLVSWQGTLQVLKEEEESCYPEVTVIKVRRTPSP